MSSPPIQWYPGHIAKAEKQLQEQLKRVDVVLEVLDARIPVASHHPQVADWIGEKPRILVLNRVDMIPNETKQEWITWFKERREKPYWTNAKAGKGIKAVKYAAQDAGAAMNQRRRDRGMRPRAVRAVVIGFPNVGKSALINRLVGRKAVASARKAGVTRQLQWVRISDEIELLDAPGVIPWRLENQQDAIKLAICEDIGEAAYDNQRVAAVFVDLLVELGFAEVLQSRYHLDPLTITGESFIQDLADKVYQGDKERVARLLLHDFRTGAMGQIPLELPNEF
ncbi:ribosome biogenesis GTP-binding protein YlqF [Stanieria cyanosphaera PCC 7437]|uniref:Ribosome biogenesis GTPase A n=1 Tax=Stanieria cyanosphaera (strain ATCC 29371 / PCC 7437) TaxID=111780 RepID=K9XU64_STAC7|nr:ribosome biogenesis GTPase YlqF [Stanieria cyanosphaera]AFZ35604.1 ribosome biogenesis GTP-binding protein YlqF [Stanieria cyanosphaera PCC 7437]